MTCVNLYMAAVRWCICVICNIAPRIDKYSLLVALCEPGRYPADICAGICWSTRQTTLPSGTLRRRRVHKVQLKLGLCRGKPASYATGQRLLDITTTHIISSDVNLACFNVRSSDCTIWNSTRFRIAVPSDFPLYTIKLTTTVQQIDFCHSCFHGCRQAGGERWRWRITVVLGSFAVLVHTQLCKRQ